MTMDTGARIGGANFALGLDLAQLTRDLDAAEALVRSRAQRIQGTISALPVGGGRAAGGFTPSRAAPAPGAANQRAGNAPAWAVEVYRRNVEAGMPPQAARAALMRATGLRADELVGLDGAGAGGGGRIPPTFSTPNGTPAPGGGPLARNSSRPLARTTRGTASGDQALSFVGLGGSQGVARTAGAVLGLGAGLNFAATAAAKLHQALAESVNSAVQLAQHTREVGVAFGGGAPAFTGPGAASFLANPLTKGTTDEYLQAAASLAPLAAQYKLTSSQVQQLIVSEGVLARLHGVDLPQAGQILQQVLHGNLEAGQALDLQLTNEYGIIRNVGLTWQQLVEAQGPAAATATVLAQAQQDVGRQLENNAKNADTNVQAFDRLGKAADRVRSALAQGVTGVAVAGANVATGVLTVGAQPPATAGPTGGIPAPAVSAATRAILETTQPLTPGAGTGGRAIPGSEFAIPNLPPAPLSGPVPGSEFAIPSITELRAQGGFRAPGSEFGIPSIGDLRTNAGSLYAEQQRLARQRINVAQPQLETLNLQSDLRRLSVQGQINELAQTRLDIEGRLAPVLLEQQRVQDAITLATRENLTLTEATLRAQQAAYPSANAAFALSYQQQRIRLQAQVQQSRAIRGLAPAAGIPGIPELFGQARDLALIAPEVNLAALQSQYPADVAARAQAQAATSRQLAAIPAQQRLQQLQDVLIPLGQARSAAQAAADAIERSLQGADLLSGPDRIKAQQDLANARIQEADAAGKIAQAQVDAGSGINATANVNIIGLTDVQAATQAVLDAFRPQIINAINAAVNNPRPPAGPPTDRGNP